MVDGRRTLKHMAHLAAGACGLAVLSACGSSSGGSAYSAAHSVPTLEAAKWQAHQAPGMPDTLAGVHQAGYLEAIAPDGAHANLQFLDTTSSANKELSAIRARRSSFAGTTVGNVLVGQSLPAADLSSLRTHLSH